MDITLLHFSPRETFTLRSLFYAQYSLHSVTTTMSEKDLGGREGRGRKNRKLGKKEITLVEHQAYQSAFTVSCAAGLFSRPCNRDKKMKRKLSQA